MEMPVNPSENRSTYFVNPEEAEETARLLLQDRFVTKETGGVFPEDLDPNRVQVVLDLACGPGGWACDVARLYPHIDVIGVDISEKMMRYAQAHAQAQRLDNVSFQVMNVINPLEFPDASFDFVNARLISAFMPVTGWSAFIQECVRITRPGGLIRLTEAEWEFTNSAACERLADMLTKAMWLDGKSFFYTNAMHIKNSFQHKSMEATRSGCLLLANPLRRRHCQRSRPLTVARDRHRP